METVICGHEVLRDVSHLALARTLARSLAGWLAGWLARVQTCSVSPIPARPLVRAFLLAQTHVETRARATPRVHSRAGTRTHTSSSESRHRVTDGRCTHLPSVLPFPGSGVKWTHRHRRKLH